MIRRRRSNIGYTLPEIIVSGGLALLVLSLMIGLLIPSFSLFRRQSGKSDSYRACLMLVHRFQQDLSNSMLETVSVSPDHEALSWQLGQDDPPFSATTGQPIMQNLHKVLFYFQGEQRVYLQEASGTASGPSVLPHRLSLAALDLARTSADNSRRVLARNITAFEVTDDDTDPALMKPPLHLTVTCTVDTAGTETQNEESFTLQASVTPRSVRW